MARALIKALSEMGAQVSLASTLRSRDGTGDTQRQSDIHARAKAQIPDLIAKGKTEKWSAWVTYHNYYKAPDLLGPEVCETLGIPYVQIESTRARKRLQGPWSSFAHAAEAAADAADLIFYFTQRDAEALKRDAPDGQQLVPLPPFLPYTTLPSAGDRSGSMLAVGMMRPGDKLASYQLIAQTLALLPIGIWQLDIVGDGKTKPEIERMMAPFRDAVRFQGLLPPEEVARAYRDAGLLFWPGVNEAFGLTYLEAQAHGLAVVAQNRPGVCDVLVPGDYPTVESGAAGLSAMLLPLLTSGVKRREVGDAARAYVAQHHLLASAAAQLQKGFEALGIAQ
ncbi:glycosyltransferase family 4 protein [Sulfitobacter sp. JB4-11]|uniref:glycosyltransferase family 4 protein n=1 Tax=Sulfitobacter rhodophyticola TaxID=3238304 RepID=UPI003D81A1F3